MRRLTPIAAGAVWLIASVLSPVLAASPETEALCRKLGTDDRLRPIPDSLVSAARRLFDLDTMSADWIRRSTYFRCFERHVLICNVGANLPCGKADVSRRLASADRWCTGHPDSDLIPMYVTGHDTIYRWHCAGARAAVSGTPLAVDQRGFIARFWSRIDPEPQGAGGALRH
jgi:hypothetical protein